MRNSRTPMWWWARGAALACVALSLGGCLNPIIIPTITAATLNYDGKAPPDYVASALTDMDCSVLHLEQDKSYCLDPAEEPPPQPKTYCYRTIGNVDCYASPPDPYSSRPVAATATIAPP